MSIRKRARVPQPAFCGLEKKENTAELKHAAHAHNKDRQTIAIALVVPNP